MDQGPLVKEEIDAGAELVREFANYRSIAAAFWLKAGEEERRYLYIASEQIDGSNRGEAYSEVNRLIEQMPSPDLLLLRVKLVNAENAFAKSAADILTRFPDPHGHRLTGARFGDTVVDDVYIYPSPLPAPVS
jgi:hypothetical protein